MQNYCNFIVKYAMCDVLVLSSLYLRSLLGCFSKEGVDNSEMTTIRHHPKMKAFLSSYFDYSKWFCLKKVYFGSLPFGRASRVEGYMSRVKVIN